MNHRRPAAETSRPLHPLEFRILMGLQEGPRHGYSIVKEVEAAEGEGRRLFPANLYRRIRDLTSRGLIEETDPPEGGEMEGRPRRYFRLTERGVEVARAEAQRLQQLVVEARERGLLSPA